MELDMTIISNVAQAVPKTPKIHTPQLFENARPGGSEIGVPETHDFGNAAAAVR